MSGNPLFGPGWAGTPRGDDPEAEYVLPPIGEPCWYCGAAIKEGDTGLLNPVMSKDGALVERPLHRDCLLESVLGPRWKERYPQ